MGWLQRRLGILTYREHLSAEDGLDGTDPVNELVPSSFCRVKGLVLTMHSDHPVVS